jgi:hypothetical protein
MVSKKVLTVFYHLLFWALIWMVPLFLLPIVEPWENNQEYEHSGIPFLVYMILMTGSFYLNIFVLYPKYLIPKKTVATFS